MARSISGTFTIILKGQPGAYTIEASGPKGIRVSPQPFSLLLSPEQQTILKRLANENVQIPSAKIQEIGHSFYKSVFTDSILLDFGRAQGRVGAKGLRLRLDIEPPELATLPWEAMYDGQEWLAAKSDTPLVRTLPQKHQIKTLQKLQVRGALKILFVGASPIDRSNLDVENTAQQLQQLLKDDIDKKRIVFDVLINAALEELRQQLVKEYHILYFAGHGSPDGIYLDDGEGGEIREGETVKRLPGDSYLISAQTLAQALEGKPTRLVFLAACNTGAASNNSGLLSNFARELAGQARLPGLVAMQYSISDIQASQLTSQFFAGLAAFQPIDVALAEARKALVRQERVGRDVIAPVMYLQADDGALFQKAKNWAAIGATTFAIIAVIAFIVQFLFFQPDRQQITNAQQTAAAEATGRANAQATAEAEATAKMFESQRADTEATEKERQERISLAKSLASQALNIVDLNKEYELATLLTIEAFRINQENQGDALALIDHTLRNLLEPTNFHNILQGHDASVRAVVYNPDGTKLVSGSTDGDVRLWTLTDPQKGSIVFNGHQGQSLAVAISADGATVASGSDNGNIYLWELEASEKSPVILDGHGTVVNDIAFSPDNIQLASVSGDSTIRIWDLSEPGIPSFALGKHDGGVLSVLFSPDGTQLVTGGDDKTIRLWSLNRPKNNPTILSEHEGFVVALAISPDGTHLASGDSNGSVRLWKMSNLNSSPTELTGEGGWVDSLDFKPSGTTLAVGRNDGNIQLWDLNRPSTPTRVLSGHAGSITSARFSPDGSELASGSFDQTIRLWKTVLTEASPVIFKYQDSEFTTFALDHSEKFLASGDKIGNIHFWDLSYLEQPISVFNIRAEPNPTAFNPVTSIAFNPNGEQLASGGQDDTVRFWSLTDLPSTALTLNAHSSWVNAVTFSPDGKWMATGDHDGNVYLWETNNDSLFKELENPDGSVTSVAFSPDGTQLAYGGAGGTIRVWMLTQLDEPPLVLSGDGRSVRSLAFSPDSKTIAASSGTLNVSVGSRDGAVHLWSLSEPEHPKLILNVPDSSVSSIAFKSDGKILASGSEDGSIRLWSLTKPENPPIILDGHDARVTSLTFYLEGARLISGSWDGTIRIWVANTNQLVEIACRSLHRNLSVIEWDQYFGDQSYHPTCVNLPIPEETD